MLEQPQSPTATHTKQQVFDHYLIRLQSEIHSILSCEADYEERVNLLQTELDVFKRQCFASEKARREIEEENYQLKARLEGVEMTIKNAEQRIICLIDGDGTIFSTSLLAQGQQGGRLAARQLSEAVQDFLPSSQQSRPLWVYIFYNRRGLLETLWRAGADYREARDGFDDFVAGFNQSCERFIMVDVGHGKEAADAKIKASLEDHLRSLHTYKIFFGGCHDNGYIPNLHSLWTSGHQDKIILLPGYDEMANEISKLPLPCLTIPGLFMSNKIVVPSRETSPTRSASLSSQTLPCSPPPGLSSPSTNGSSSSTTRTSASASTPSSSPTLSEAVAGSPNKLTSAERTASPKIGPALSYRSVLQTIPQNHNSVSSKTGGEYASTTHARSLVKSKRINPNLPLNRHDPPPCTLFYLAANGCKFGPECRYGHDYELVDDDYEILRRNAKKYPCPALNRGDPCVFGEDCCYGHTCPQSTTCRFNKLGQCHFKAASMHRDA